MRVSLEWLNEYVNLDGLSAETIAEALTNAGLEVEEIQRLGGNFSGVYVGKVQAVDPHPNADKLRLVTVDLKTETMQVVCGAPNVEKEMLIAFAKVGAQVINRKDGTSFTLEPAKIRGVESSGMICSLDELGLQDLYPKGEDGIWPLGDVVSEETLGQDLKQALKLEADTVLDVAPTANRGDLMSILGVAREIAALFDRDVHLPEAPHFPSNPAPPPVLVKLPQPEVCQYYAGAILKNVKVGPAPDWMSRRLQAAGIRPINNVVDITNYVMLETGQPLHAFDQVKLGMAGEVSVRRARDGETLTTLDEIQRKLNTESVLITMNQRLVALAGVMGGRDTEIDEASQHVFLESAYFPQATNRRSAKSVGIRTEASARFERGVDPGTCKLALQRALVLLKKHAGAEYVNFTESAPYKPREVEVSLRYKRIDKLLGLHLDPEQVSKVLRKLGFLLKPSKDHDKVLVSVPTYRQHDVSREIDLIEEIIRIYGYDNVPYTLPEKTASVPSSFRRNLLSGISRTLSGTGLHEVVTTSLIGEALLEKTGFLLDRDQLVRVTNSHSEEHTLLRQSLLPNLIEVGKFNQAQGIDDVWIFELGRTYFKKGKPAEKHSGVVEKLCASGLITGSELRGDWHLKAPTDFYTAKGILESLFTELLPTSGTVRFEPEKGKPFLHPGKSARILLSQGKSSPVTCGFLGELHPTLQELLKFRQPVYLFELDVEALHKFLKQLSDKAPPTRISAFPSVKRDIAFLAPETLSHQEILTRLQSLENPMIRHIQLFDEYRGQQLGQGNRSLAYRFTLQSDESTLTDADIEAVMGKVKQTLSETLPVTFR